MAERLVGSNYVTPDIVAKVTGRARYAEDFRADGMLFCKLMPSERPHARVRAIDTSRAMRLEGVRAILTPDDVPQLGGTTEHCLTREPLYAGEPILAVAATSEEIAAEAIELIQLDLEPLPHVTDPIESLRPGSPNARTDGNVWVHRIRPAAAPDDPGIEVDRSGLRRRGRWPGADGQGDRGMVVRRSRRGIQERRADARRIVRRAVHRTSSPGDAQRDGVLAEREAPSALLDSERGAHG